VADDVNWTAVGSIAAVAAVLVAFLSYRAQVHPPPPVSPTTSAYTAPTYNTPTYNAPTQPIPATTVAVGSLPEPCDLPDASTIAQFQLETGKPTDDPGQNKEGCDWFYPDGGRQELVSVTYFGAITPGDTSGPAGDAPVTITGVSGAVESPHQELGGCNVTWGTSFGWIDVDATGETPTCRVAVAFADALGPDLPR
jgi:hypothetical protein